MNNTKLSVLLDVSCGILDKTCIWINYDCQVLKDIDSYNIFEIWILLWFHVDTKLVAEV